MTITLRTAPAILAASLIIACDTASDPTPQPTPIPDGWFGFAVECANCPGLSNAPVDRTTIPHRARLRVGEQTSLRAAVRSPCEPAVPQPEITRWIAGNSQAIRIDPTSPDSAILTALAPGTSSITLERRLGNGTLSQKSLKDAQATAGCGTLPDVVFEIVP